MAGKHAKLSPSSAERWISCPASVLLSETVPPQPESSYAAEGTAAHALGELKARHQILETITDAQYRKERIRWEEEFGYLFPTEESIIEVERHTDAWVDLLVERMALYPHSQLMLEQRLDTGVPLCWGTSDAVIVSPVHVEIVDFKYGQGVAVEAVGNPQLRLYGLGALEAYGDLLGDTELVRITVHQPRLDHVLTEELTPDELRSWRDTKVLPMAELALEEDAPFGPSEEACRWCPVSGRCQAQLKSIFDEVDFDQDPKTLSEEEVGEVLGRVGHIRDWLKAFEETALTMAYSEQREIPGYKVVLSGGKRSIADPEAAIKFLVEDQGYAEEDVARRSIRTFGDLEKLMGKAEFAEIMVDYIKPPVGKPAIVPDTDKRQAINPNSEAQKEFGDG